MSHDNAPAMTATATHHPLARRWPVWLTLALAFGLLAWGEIRATDPYTSPAFVVGYFWTEVQVSTLMLVATLLFLSLIHI